MLRLLVLVQKWKIVELSHALFAISLLVRLAAREAWKIPNASFGASHDHNLTTNAALEHIAPQCKSEYSWVLQHSRACPILH